jgi:outer membrane protein
MKALTVALLAGCVLVAGVAYAQQPPVQQQTPPPAQQTPLPAQQQPPAVPPAAAPQAAPAPAPKFPEGAKYAFINIQRIASESAEGKASSSRIEALRAKKAAELTEKNKAVEALQAKQRSAVMSEAAAAQVQKDIDKAQVDIQRMTQDAQAELQDLQNELQLDFQRKVGPVIEAVAREKELQLLFSQADSGLVWADAGLDLTAEVIRRLDAASAAAQKPAPPKK